MKKFALPLLLLFFAVLWLAIPTFPLDGIWEGNQLYRFFNPTDGPALFNKIILRANIGPYNDPYGYALLGFQRPILDFFNITPSFTAIRSILVVYYILTGLMFFRLLRIFLSENMALGSTALFMSHSWILGYANYFQPIIVCLLVLFALLERAHYLYKETEFDKNSWHSFFMNHWGQISFALFMLVFCAMRGRPGRVVAITLIIFGAFVFLRKKGFAHHTRQAALSVILRMYTFGAAAVWACTHYIFVRYVFILVALYLIAKALPLKSFYDKGVRFLSFENFRNALIFLPTLYFFFMFLKVSFRHNIRMLFDGVFLRINKDSLAESVFTHKSGMGFFETIFKNIEIFWISFLNGQKFFEKGTLDLANFFLDGYYQFTPALFFFLGVVGFVVSFFKLPKKYFIGFLIGYGLFFVLPLLSVIHTSESFLNPTVSTHRLVFLLIPLIPCYVMGAQWLAERLAKTFAKGHKRLCMGLAGILVIVPCGYEIYRYNHGIYEIKQHMSTMVYEDSRDYIYIEGNPRDVAPQRGVRFYFYLLAKKLAELQKSEGKTIYVEVPVEDFLPKKVYSREGYHANLYYLGKSGGTVTKTPHSHLAIYLPALMGEFGVRANYVTERYGTKMLRWSDNYDIFLIFSEEDKKVLKEHRTFQVTPFAAPLWGEG